MKIEYDKGGNLYVLATQLDLIQKYAGADAKKTEAEPSGRTGVDKDPASGYGARYRKWRRNWWNCMRPGKVRKAM